MSLLEISGINKQFGGSFAVKDAGFTQPSLHKISITGETGSGKSTLLKIIAGLVQPDSGKVLFDGETVKGPDEKLVPGHPGIAYLSQDHELRNNYRMEELLEYANKLPGNEAAALYKVCRIDHLLKRKNDQLSGGEKQRIALARLLVSAPRLLLLDEPFSNLDKIHKQVLKHVIADIGEKLQTTCILTSHDPLDTLSWADEIIVLKEGAIIQQGAPMDIYRSPVNEYTAGLFGRYNLLGRELAAALGVLEPVHDGKKLFIRPEHFRICPAGSGVAGTVGKLAFWGGYWEVEVLIGDTLIVVHILDAAGIGTGSQVGVAVVCGDKWYV